MKKKKQKHNDTKLSLWREGLRPETRHSVGAIVAFAIGAVILLAYFGKAGVVGDMTHRLFLTLFRIMFFLVRTLGFCAHRARVSLLRLLRGESYYCLRSWEQLMCWAAARLQGMSDFCSHIRFFDFLISGQVLYC